MNVFGERSTIKDEYVTGMVLGIAKLMIIGRFQQTLLFCVLRAFRDSDA